MRKERVGKGSAYTLSPRWAIVLIVLHSDWQCSFASFTSATLYASLFRFCGEGCAIG